ncbi:hypothetical protein LJB81_02310 [Desulfovibrio sp. OttesenSCG-928-M14]|nr:hypothetical protein [Desulfovibrio sp. OttesenSCG-928-M14]
MAGTHILEANYEILNNSFIRHSGLRPTGLHKNEPSFGARWAALAADSLFAVLERLKLCHGPRILSAQCLCDSTTTFAAKIRQ